MIVVWSILCVYICMRALVCAVFHELLVPLRVPRCDRRRFLQFMNNSGYNLIYCPPLFSLPCAHPVYVPLWPSFKFGLSAEKISGWVRSRALTIFHVGQGAAKGHAFILA